MKKAMIKYLLAAVLVVVGSQAAFAQYYTVNAIPVCWTTAGGIDSTIYESQLDATQKTRPDRKYYFNAQGNAVSVIGGTLRFGSCQEYALLDSIAQIVTNTTEPQQCECEYAIDLHDQSISVDANATQPVWNYTQVVTRNCGAGAEVVASIPTATPTPKVWHSVSGTSMVSGASILDSLRVSYGPSSHFNIYLSPIQVKIKYPLLAIDTATLRYNSASPTTMATAVTTVINYALNKWATDTGRSIPQRDFSVTVNGTTHFIIIYWNIINNPSGDYINIVNGATRIWYHRVSATLTTGTSMGFAGSTQNVTHTYATPCGLVASVSYQCNLTLSDSIQVNFDAIPLISPLDTNRFAYVTRICSEPCPEGGGCTTICNDESNPVPVKIISDPVDCPVTGRAGFPLNLTNSTGTIAANLYHSLVISVTSGTATISAINPDGTESATFSAGTNYAVSAAECELIPTSFSITATSGSVIVSATK